MATTVLSAFHAIWILRVSELEIVREGDSIILRPVRPTWGSFLELEKADPDFMTEREDVVSDEGRVNL